METAAYLKLCIQREFWHDTLQNTININLSHKIFCQERLMVLCFSSFHYNFDSEISEYIKESIRHLISRYVILIQTMTREDAGYLFHIQYFTKQIQNEMWQIYLKETKETPMCFHDTFL